MCLGPPGGAGRPDRGSHLSGACPECQGCGLAGVTVQGHTAPAHTLQADAPSPKPGPNVLLNGCEHTLDPTVLREPSNGLWGAEPWAHRVAPTTPSPVVPAVCPHICHGAPQRGNRDRRTRSGDTAATTGTGEAAPAQLIPGCGREEVARGCLASCLSDAVTSSSGEELRPAICPCLSMETAATAPSRAPSPAQPRSPLVEVVLGVVQPQPHGHRVALPALCEDVVHGSCRGTWVRTWGQTPDPPRRGGPWNSKYRSLPPVPVPAALQEAAGRLRSGLEPDLQPKGNVPSDSSGAMATHRKPGWHPGLITRHSWPRCPQLLGE